MNNQIKNLLNSGISEYSMMLIVFCLTVNIVLSTYFGELTQLEVAPALVGGVIFIAWLIWATYVLITKKVLAPMSRKHQLMVETISIILMLTWVYIKSQSILFVIPPALLLGWNEYRLIADIYKSSEE